MYLPFFVLLGFAFWSWLFDRQILMDKYLGLGLDNGMADLGGRSPCGYSVLW